jgi:hypothetical protein
MAQGQGDLLVRTVRGAPAAWGVGKYKKYFNFIYKTVK